MTTDLPKHAFVGNALLHRVLMTAQIEMKQDCLPFVGATGNILALTDKIPEDSTSARDAIITNVASGLVLHLAADRYDMGRARRAERILHALLVGRNHRRAEYR